MIKELVEIDRVWDGKDFYFFSKRGSCWIIESRCGRFETGDFREFMDLYARVFGAAKRFARENKKGGSYVKKS